MPSVTLNPSKDAHVDQSNPTVNYDTIDLQVRANISSNEKMSFIEFDISSLPGNIIIDTAKLRLKKATNPLLGKTLNIHRVTSTWNDTTITFNTVPTISSDILESWIVSSGGINTYVEKDIKRFVDMWHLGIQSNFGIRIIDIGIDNEIMWFHRSETPGNEPELVITYHTFTASVEQNDLWAV